MYYPISQEVKATRQWEIIFLKNHIQNVVKLAPEPFVKNEKLSISQDQMSEMLQNLFLSYVQIEVYQNISKLRC